MFIVSDMLPSGIPELINAPTTVFVTLTPPLIKRSKGPLPPRSFVPKKNIEDTPLHSDAQDATESCRSCPLRACPPLLHILPSATNSHSMFKIMATYERDNEHDN